MDSPAHCHGGDGKHGNWLFQELGITRFEIPVNLKGLTAVCIDPVVAMGLGGIVVAAHSSTIDDPAESK